MTDILEKLDGAWDEDFKMNLMHYCDLAGQEIRKLRTLAAKISVQYENQDMSHVDFRVWAKLQADAALTPKREAV